MIRNALPPELFSQIIEGLRLSIFVFSGGRLIYVNPAARDLTARLRRGHGIELPVTLRDSLNGLGLDATLGQQAVSTLTSPNGQPFFVHVMTIAPAGGPPQFVVTVRETGAEQAVARRRYGLSPREAQVLELVLRGYANQDIARTLSITPATAKKHLTRIFDKVGVDSRAQLISRLA